MIADLKDLKAGTYKIAKLTLNGKEIDLGAIKDQEFKIEVPKQPSPAPVVPSPVQPKPVEEVVPKVLFSFNTKQSDQSYYASITPEIVSFLKKHQSQIDQNDKIEFKVHLKQVDKANTQDQSLFQTDGTITYTLKDLIASEHPDLTRYALTPNSVNKTSLRLTEVSLNVKNSELLNQLKSAIEIKDSTNKVSPITFETKVSDTNYKHDLNPTLSLTNFDQLNQLYYDNSIAQHHPDLYLTLINKPSPSHGKVINQSPVSYFNINGALNQYLKTNNDPVDPNDSIVFNYSINQLNSQTHKIDSTNHSLTLKLSDLKNIDADNFKKALLNFKDQKDQYELLKKPDTQLAFNNVVFNIKDQKLLFKISNLFKVYNLNDQIKWISLTSLTTPNDQNKNQFDLKKAIVIKDYDQNTYQEWSNPKPQPKEPTKEELLAKETVITPIGKAKILPLTTSLFTKTNKNQDFSETQEWLTLSKPYTQTYHIENIDLDTLPDNVSVVVSYDGIPPITVKIPKSSFTNINQLHTSCDVNITLPINEYLQKLEIRKLGILTPSLKSVTLQYTLHSQDKHFKTFDLLKINPSISTRNITNTETIDVAGNPTKYMPLLPPVFEDLHVEQSSNPSFDSYFVKFKVILTPNYAKLIEHLDNKFNVELKSSNKVIYTKEFNNVGGNNYASASDYVIIKHGDKDPETNVNHNTTLFVTLKVPKSAIKNENSKLELSKFEFGGTNFALTKEKQRPKLFNISLKNPGPLKQD